MKEIYRMTKEELLLRYPYSEGLAESDAKQRLEEQGENVLEETAKKSVLSVFLGQFADLLSFLKEHTTPITTCNADICFPGFTGAIHNTAHNRNSNRLLTLFQRLIHLVD